MKAPSGAVVVFDSKGGFGDHLRARPAERLESQLRVFRIARDGGGISDVTSHGYTRLFVDRTGERAAQMGITLYRRARDGAIFAVVAPKNGPRAGYLG